MSTALVAASGATYLRDTQGNLESSLSNQTSGGNTTATTANAIGYGIQAKYDAWNRLVRVDVLDDAGNVRDQHVEQRYDATGRLAYTEEHAVVGGLGVGATMNDARHYYYDVNGNAIEERPGGSGAADVRYLIGPADGQVVLRDRDADGVAGNGLEQRLYALQDASGNTTALADAAGAIVERYVYDALGNVQALDAAWGERYLGGTNSWGDARHGDEMLGEYFVRPATSFLGGGNVGLAGTAYAWRHYAGGAAYERIPGVYLGDALNHVPCLKLTLHKGRYVRPSRR